jgi:hypothetical protein
MYLAFFILVNSINPNLYAGASLQFTYNDIITDYTVGS